MINKIRWSEVEREQVAPKMERRMIYGDQIMVTKMKFKDGFVVPLHSHENEQVTEVISGTIRFWFGEDESQVVDVHAGETVVIPSNLPHKAQMIGDVEEMDIFCPPRQDWIDKTDDYLRNSK